MSRLKAQDLANHLSDKRTGLRFDIPRPALDRSDTEAARNMILSLTTTEAKRLGIRRNTLWYVRQRAQASKPIKIYNKVESKMMLPGP